MSIKHGFTVSRKNLLFLNLGTVNITNTLHCQITNGERTTVVVHVCTVMIQSYVSGEFHHCHKVLLLHAICSYKVGVENFLLHISIHMFELPALPLSEFTNVTLSFAKKFNFYSSSHYKRPSYS